jgi:hypothetical protein
MNDVYCPIIEALRARSLSTYFQGEQQLVVSRRRDAVLPSGGNSFWLSNQRGAWYLCTWAPNCYRVPPEMDLVTLCEAFADFSLYAQGEVPPHLVERFRLTKLSIEEAGERFKW